MNISKATIAWTPANATGHYAKTAGQIVIAGRPPHEAVDPYQYWVYAEGGGKEQTGVDGVLRLFLQFNTCVVRDGIDPAVAHKAFLELDEYRFHISRDMQGVQDQPEDYELTH